jgi:predicted HD phosphohydrolase
MDGTYRARLSRGSIRTLAAQQGPMNSDEVRAFATSSRFDAAICLRRADESAKDPVARVAPLDTWQPTLVAVAG